MVRDTVGSHDTFTYACTSKYYEDMGYLGLLICSDIFNGVWGAFPYYDSNKVVISDGSQGLFVVEFNHNLVGDLNLDGIVNVIDIIVLVNFIINEQSKLK